MFGLRENLDEHSAALTKLGRRVALFHKQIRIAVNVQRQDLADRLCTELLLEQSQSVLVAGICRGLHLTAVVGIPEIGKFAEAQLFIEMDICLTLLLKVLDLCQHFSAGFPGEANNMALTYVGITGHQLCAPGAILQLTDITFTLGTFPHVPPP